MLAAIALADNCIESAVALEMKAEATYIFLIFLSLLGNLKIFEGSSIHKYITLAKSELATESFRDPAAASKYFLTAISMRQSTGPLGNPSDSAGKTKEEPRAAAGASTTGNFRHCI